MELKKKCPLKEGFTPMVNEDDPLIKKIIFGIISLAKGKKYESLYEKHEVALIILSGTCSIKAGDETFSSIGKRENVFQGRAHALYLPPGVKFEVTGESKCEIAVCGAPTDKKTKVKLVTPEDNKEKTVGKDNWQRKVYDIIDSSVEADKLLIGETVNPPGNWSSAPPHRHEVDNFPEESKHEEVYFFKVNPEKGFGIQRIYTDDRSLDQAYAVENNDTVLLPRGYHPVVAGPGYGLYYLWVLSGDKRVAKMRDDPEHTWIKG